MRQLKSRRFSRVFAEYLRNGSIDFHQTYVIFRQSSMVFFEIKRLKTGHVYFVVVVCCLLLPWQPILEGVLG